MGDFLLTLIVNLKMCIRLMLLVGCPQQSKSQIHYKDTVTTACRLADFCY